MSNRKYFTVKQFVGAIEKNGFPQARKTFVRRTYRFGKAEIGAACAIGQGVVNLGVSYDNLNPIKNQEVSQVNTFYRMWADIIRMNDDENHSIPFIVEYLRNQFADIMDLRLGGDRIDWYAS